MSLVRNDSIYVRWRTRRRLKWIAKAASTSATTITADEVADRLLNEVIEQKYPRIGELEKQMEETEDRILEQLAETPNAERPTPNVE